MKKKRRALKWFTPFIAWVDRRFNLAFNKEHCVKMELDTESRLIYNTMLYTKENTFRHLGKKWFILIK